MSKLVLIVDDSSTAVDQFKTALLKNNFETIVATNGADAIAMAKENKPDVILMDIVMPGEINGFQATRQITRDLSTKDIPVIMVTNKNQETDRIWGKRQGAKWYLVKPVADAELIDTVNKALALKAD
jgi:twitching motility two-component system response regulator PilH